MTKRHYIPSPPAGRRIILGDVLRSRTPGAFWRTFNPLEEEYERRVTPDAEPSS
jgi:hypothetical protein